MSASIYRFVKNLYRNRKLDIEDDIPDVDVNKFKEEGEKLASAANETYQNNCALKL